MKRCVTAIAFFMLTFFVSSWGFQPHKLINLNAIFTLPPNLAIFYKKHSFQIREFAVNADKRVYIDPKESPRHFIDLDKIENTDSLLIPWYKVREKFNEKIILSKGIVPWQIDNSYRQLVKAFYNKDMTRIIKLSADLGHYVGDAHMPLHTSANHDGQLTDQKGIHSLWESRLPELFVKNYKLNVPEAQYYPDVHKAIWDLINDTHSLAQPLLDIDKKLRTATPQDKVFKLDAEGNVMKTRYNTAVFSEDYAKKLHEQLNGMVESQMKKAIAATASFWYTAWINAGKPDLSDLDAPAVTQRNYQALQDDLKLFQKGDLFGMKNQND